MSCEERDRPDLVFLQEVGLAKLNAGALGSGSGTQGAAFEFASAVFEQALCDAYPLFVPLLKVYQVLNVSPKLDVRRGGGIKFTDVGLILAKRSVAEAYIIRPITSSAC